MLKQQLQLKLSQKLSPQQIQLMKLIQLSTLDLEQRIQSEIGENPALEKGKEIEVDSIPSDEYGDSQQDQNINTEDINIDSYLSDDEIPSYRVSANNQSNDEDEKMIPFSGRVSFHEYLGSQLQSLILDDGSGLKKFGFGPTPVKTIIKKAKHELKKARVTGAAFLAGAFVPWEI